LVTKASDPVMQQLLWAARLGELCARCCDGPAPERTFLHGWLQLVGADWGWLALSRPSGEVVRFAVGLDGLSPEGDPRLEPELLSLLAGDRSVVMLARPGDATGWPRSAATELLRVAVRDETGDRASLVVGWSDEAEPPMPSIDRHVAVLAEPLLRALGELAEGGQGGAEEDEARAWDNSRVPLIFLSHACEVLDANPAASRKLGVAGSEPQLPPWLQRAVEERIRLLERTGEGLAELSGEHTYLGVTDGRLDYRVGIAPVVDEGRGLRWLLSVEKRGPSIWERIERSEATWGLTPRESLALELVARGMANKQIAEVLTVTEATVKFHLYSVMKKSRTKSRTELLATFYSGFLARDDESGGDHRGETIDLDCGAFSFIEPGLISFVLAPETEFGVEQARSVFELLAGRVTDSQMRLYADISGLRSVSPEAQTFFAARTGTFLSAVAIRAGSAVPEALVSLYEEKAKPPYPMRVFATELEALSWLRTVA
jgi:DNA-binding CsgD family transcriptional regulator